jgi:hypothetical protein
MHVLGFAKKRKRLTAVVALVVAASVIGVAVAAWTSGGSGSGQAQAGSAASLTISAGTPSSSLYPLGSADVAASIGNSNPFKVHISSITLGSITVDAGHSGCNTSSLSVTSPQTNGGSGWDVAASGNLTVHLANAISMDNTANDACQGATFTVALTATGASAP